MKNKSEYKDMWVYIQHDGETVHPVSLELCCEIRKIADVSKEALVAVIVGEFPESEKEKILEEKAKFIKKFEGNGMKPHKCHKKFKGKHHHHKHGKMMPPAPAEQETLPAPDAE